MRLLNYNLGYKILSFAKTEESYNYMKNRNYECVFLDKNILTIYPENKQIELLEEEKEFFDKINDYSILELNKYVKVIINSGSFENVFLITNKCNSNCVMCPISNKQRKESSVESIENLLKICKQLPLNLPHITITGGEPFILGKDIFNFFSYLKKYHNSTEYLLLTNGRIFSNIEYFKNFKQVVPKKILIGIPIHGYNEESHDFITRTNGSFRQTIIGIKRLISAKIQVELRIVVSKLNYKNLDKIAQMIIKELAGVYTVKFIGLEMLGNARINQDIVWIDYKNSFEYMKLAIDKLVRNKINVGIYNYPLCCVERGYWGICAKSISDYKVRYSGKCEMCTVKDACGGIFAGTFGLMEGNIEIVR